ncbi:hypothetical protein AVEN_275404-1 [Araneus ventricosus]|uniref:Uncharacterized protein n=1 Tax=Araneus ventricosus TaxID=182803 RepID=A0A4Y2PML2_ARAVE|nr:hypothetical protein AVEN_275404-1 [Araneus ventricosus]
MELFRHINKNDDVEVTDKLPCTFKYVSLHFLITRYLAPGPGDESIVRRFNFTILTSGLMISQVVPDRLPTRKDFLLLFGQAWLYNCLVGPHILPSQLNGLLQGIVL